MQEREEKDRKYQKKEKKDDLLFLVFSAEKGEKFYLVCKQRLYIYIIYFVYAFLFKHQESVCEFRQVVTM